MSVHSRTNSDAAITAAPIGGDPLDRVARQAAVHAWCKAAFGADHASSATQRGVRFLEEAIELYQALGCDRAMGHDLLDYIFDREPGEVAQEMGGVGMTLLALGGAIGVVADEAEEREFRRVLSKPLAWFHARNEVKNAAGFDVTGGAYPAESGADDHAGSAIGAPGSKTNPESQPQKEEG